MKSTIWFFNDYAGSPYHGMEFRNYYIARDLVKLGYKVYIVTASYMHLFKNLPKTTGDYTFENIDGIEYIWVDVPHYKSSTDKKRVWKWFVFVKKLFSLPTAKMEKPDFIIASPMAPFLLWPASYFSKKYKSKLVYEIKDIWPLSLMELGGYSKNNPLIFLMQKFANFGYKNADVTMSVLLNAHEYMKEYGLKKDRFKYLPNGISLQEMQNIKPLNNTTKRLLPKEGFLVGYTGTLGIANAIDSFIQSAEYLKGYSDIKFILVGDGKDKINLEELANKLNLKNIIFIDAIEKNEVQSLLKELDICYIGWHKKKIYDYGIAANKIFDYMYAKKPIVHAFSGQGDLVKIANCGVSVEALNPKAIAEGILKLYGLDANERIRLGENGNQYVVKYHTYENISKEFINTLEGL